MRRTSIEAYQKIKYSGLLKGRRMEVYEWLYHNGPATGTQVSNGLLKRNCNSANVRARLNELREMGVVYEVDEVKCPCTKQTVIQWDVTEKLPREIPKAKGAKPFMLNKKDFREFLADIGVGYDKRQQIDEYLGWG